ncbi:uncharacterized protein [Amphiura filiformis]|uniref:uncharacterized protein n=1 Tax=Amphiura filiformis TaxID=82378 RepID=UPI003B2260E5
MSVTEYYDHGQYAKNLNFNHLINGMATALDDGTGVIQVYSKADLDSYIADNELVVVMYGARWCLKCVVGLLAYVSHTSRSIYAALTFLKVDVTDSPPLADQAGLYGIPSWHFYRSGKKISEMWGHDPSTLKRKLSELAAFQDSAEYGVI